MTQKQRLLLYGALAILGGFFWFLHHCDQQEAARIGRIEPQLWEEVREIRSDLDLGLSSAVIAEDSAGSDLWSVAETVPGAWLIELHDQRCYFATEEDNRVVKETRRIAVWCPGAKARDR